MRPYENDNISNEAKAYEYKSDYHYSAFDVRESELLQFVTAIITGVLFYSMVDVYWVTAIGVSITVYALMWYLESLGRDTAILPIMLVIASFQWILGPIIAYHWGGETLRYRMYVPEEAYMNFAVPAVVLLMFGLRVISSKVNLAAIDSHVKQGGLSNNHIFILVFLGFSVELAVPFIPSSLFFGAYIISQFKYIGLLYFIVSNHRYRWFFTILIFALSFATSADDGLFHSLILWSALIFSYICFALQFSRSKKIMIFVVGLMFITLLQVVKADYRAEIERNVSSGESNVSILMEMLWGSTIDIGTGNTETDIGALNARLNQGWIISSVMKHVPSAVPFVEGETIILALQDSLIPRFLMEKRSVRVSDNFEKFTGLSLNRNTSMGISVLGEAYVNFGVLGGVVFMFFWGIAIALLMKVIVDTASNHPTIILWTPLIFLQMVKAETEIVVVINHGIKTSIAIALFYIVSKKILGWKI